MIDLEELDRINQAGDRYGHITPGVAGELIAEVRALRGEIERHQALCAAAYQLAGTMNAPVRFLDAFSDGSNGELELRAKTDDLLPVSPDEVGCFPSDEGAEYREDAERYRYIRDTRNNGYILAGHHQIGKFEIAQKVRAGEAHYFVGEYLDAAIDAARKEPT